MRKHWPELTGYATAVWSFAYGVLGVYWSLGGAGFPFAKVADDRATGSILEGSSADVVAPIMAAVGLGGAVLAIVMTGVAPAAGCCRRSPRSSRSASRW